MPSKTQLEAEVEAINKLILDILKRRAVRGKWNGREYTLHNLSDLKKLRDDLEAELGLVDGTGRQVRSIVPRG